MTMPRILPSHSSSRYSFHLKTIEIMATIIFAKISREATKVLIAIISELLFSKYSLCKLGSVILRVILDSKQVKILENNGSFCRMH